MLCNDFHFTCWPDDALLKVTNIKQVWIAISFCKFIQQHWLFNGRKVKAQNVHTVEIILHHGLTALGLWFSLGLSYFVCWFLELKPLDLSYLPNFAQIGFGIFDIWCLCWDWFCHIWGGGAGCSGPFVERFSCCCWPYASNVTIWIIIILLMMFCHLNWSKIWSHSETLAR